MHVFLLPVPESKSGWVTCEVDPYTGNITFENTSEKVLPINRFFQLTTGLHCHLLLPYKITILGVEIEIGRLIVGVSTLIFVFVAFSGFILWLPRTLKAWKSSFRIRFWNGFWAFVYDFHRVVGIFVMIPVLICALSGLCWSFSWFDHWVNYLLLGKHDFNSFTNVKIEPVDDSMQPLPIGKIIERVNKLLPEQGGLEVYFPKNREYAMEIHKNGNYDCRMLWDTFRGALIPVEDSNGKMVEIEHFVDKPFGAKIAGWIPQFHYGRIPGLGLFSKIIFFLACLFATTLPVTGIIFWSRKLYLKRKIRRNKSS
jgi:uncharacterized iron-regulated membrane protein